jgi:alkylation response protein AidB-like acyl-CoA dehydrogenase
LPPEVDEKARCPEEALKALKASGFNAIHVPEEYGGQAQTWWRRSSRSKRSPASTHRHR